MTQPNGMEWKHLDRAGWPEGPWDQEPDKVQWVDEATGLDCLLHRGPHGAWCGYVGVPEGHPAFAKGYDHVEADVHGGLTYSNFCQVHPDGTEHPERGICHMPLPGRPHRVWWLGFDCAHAYDRTPAFEALSSRRFTAPENDDVYRDRAYVEQEVTSLAKQLQEMARA